MSAVKNILFLPSWYPTRHDKLNGVFNRELAELIGEKENVHVLHLCFDPSVSIATKVENKKNGIKETVIYLPSSANPVLKQWIWIREFFKAFKDIQLASGKPDLAHVQVAWKMGLAALLLKWRFGIPYIITEHYTGYLKEDGSLKGWKKWASVFLLKRAKKVTAVSEGLKLAIENAGVKNVVGIANCIDPEFFKPEYRQNSLTKDSNTKVRFIHISNFDLRQKQTDKIISAFQNVHGVNSEIELILVVPKAKIEAYFAIHAGMNMSGISILEPGLPRDELASLISSCDALISYSLYETFGLTVAESLCLGVPVMYTKCGGPEGFVLEGLGICVDKNDVKSLEIAMLNFGKTATFDRENIALQAAEIFNRKAILHRWQSLYNSSLK